MRIAVTGREGQVVTSLIERAASRADVEVIAVGRPELKLDDAATIRPALEAAQPDVIVSAAAYTAVDQAEDEPDVAMAVNGDGARQVARTAAALGVPVIHISTDYVFDGTADRPYVETDLTGPRSAYGASKLAGELAVAEETADHLILRTAWVYSPFGKNFVKTMLRLAADRDELTIVADQWGNPTSALDIADGVLHAAAAMRDGTRARGIYHLAGTGDTNWSGFARAILAASAERGGPSARVADIPTSAFPTKAARPANSRLSTQRFADDFGWTAPDWRASLGVVLDRLVGRAGA